MIKKQLKKTVLGAVGARRLLCAVTLIAVIGLSMTACKDEVSNPLSQLLEWTQGTKNYKLAITELGKDLYTYILSVGSDGYSVGTVSTTGSAYSFKSDPQVYGSGDTFAMTIDTSAKTSATVKTAADKTIKLVKNGSVTTSTLPKTDANATLTENTGGKGENPFVGKWEDDGVSVNVSKNLTWSAKATGYKGDGSYAYINDEAIIYDSKGNFFGYAYINSSGAMVADTFNGDYTFLKK